MWLVAFSGYARSGKDEAAKALLKTTVLGFERVAFADKLRECLHALNPIVGAEVIENGEILQTLYLDHVIFTYGWDGYKETKWGGEIRRLLQRLGTEAGRKTISDDIWIRAALDNLDPQGAYVVTDARYQNEADAIRQRGGKIYRIVRPGVGPANDHPSETSLDNYDFDGVIHNDGTLEEFHKSVLLKVLER